MKIEQECFHDILFDIDKHGAVSIKQDKDDGTSEYILIDKAGAEKLIEQLFRYVSGE
ncbi:hypothetical protein KK001_07475 [Enterobacter roggenkampii]|uniref:hypothetical protein n=1 Tax=Enterobacter roggenkampii TaxID=1812935 RepID=UPI001BE05EA1|nr:hypothetical protein [Enterobacter roggenkampii]MBT1888206.1 hypothetical protein [Enterobacter roggenkampii]